MHRFGAHPGCRELPAMRHQAPCFGTSHTPHHAHTPPARRHFLQALKRAAPHRPVHRSRTQLKVSAASATSYGSSGDSLSVKFVYHVVSFLERAPIAVVGLADKIMTWAIDRHRWLAWLLIVYFSVTVCGVLYHTGSLDVEAVLAPTEKWLLSQGYGDELTAQLVGSTESFMLGLVNALDWFATLWVTRSLWLAHAANIRHLQGCSPRDSDAATSPLPNTLFYLSLALRALMYLNIGELGLLSKAFDNLYWGFLLGHFRRALGASPLPTTAMITAPLLALELLAWLLIDFNDSPLLCALYTAVNAAGLIVLYEVQLRKGKAGVEKYAV